MKTFCILLFFLAGLCGVLPAQTVDSQVVDKQLKSLFESFERDSFLSLTLETNYSHLKKKRELKTYQSGKVTYTDAEGKPLTWDVEVKTRGKTRLAVCDFPPLRIKFSKSELEAQGYRPFHTLEITLTCKDLEHYQQFVLKEMLAYRLYNLMTDRSFRVKLAKLRIYDTGKKEVALETYAILLESQKELEDRLGSKGIKSIGLNAKKMQREDFDRLSMFQYMIGNTDWYLANQHNVKMIAMKGLPLPVAVPYDFDYSGLVATPYAVHHDRFVSTTIASRFYMGSCRTEEEMTKTATLFLEKKNEILELPNSIYGMDKKVREKAKDYLSDFFDRIADAKKRKRNLMNECGKWLE